IGGGLEGEVVVVPSVARVPQDRGAGGALARPGGDRSLRRMETERGRAARDNERHGGDFGFDHFDKAVENGHGGVELDFAVLDRGVVDVAVVGVDTGEVEGGILDEAAHEGESFGSGGDAGAVHAAVEVEKKGDGFFSGPDKSVHGVSVVHEGGKTARRIGLDEGEKAIYVRPHERVGEEDVRHSGEGGEFGLGDGGALYRG